MPSGDGWGWLYRWFDRMAPPGSVAGRIVCGYFWPKELERAHRGGIYRSLGVDRFGRVIPTGGVAVRRLTGARMAPYTLRGTSLDGARDFYYRTCVFEAAHTPFLVALLAITVHQLTVGRMDLAAEDMVVNLGMNVYPIMHHRRTRARIVRLLDLAQRRRRKPGRGAP